MSRYFKEFLEALSQGSVERRTILESGAEAIFQDGRLITSSDGSRDFSSADLTETVKAEPHLILFGSGHIGKALYDIGTIMQMRMTVLDDRAELLTEERFPLAERHIAPFSELLKKEYEATAPCYVIFTHGHSYDTECLRYALRRPASYIGMIGSRAKSARSLAQLREEGFSEESLSAVHTPIGLPIGAETPEEIAVSIMAEIISIFRSGDHFTTIDPSLLRFMADRRGIAVRIVDKRGSAPRSIGSMMAVTESGIAGTVGGGAIEMAAVNEAREMIASCERYRLRHYDLTASGDIGMVCGGNETLLFTPF